MAQLLIIMYTIHKKTQLTVLLQVLKAANRDF